MRRSGAPSFSKNKANSIQARGSPTGNSSLGGPKTPDDAVRSTSRILSLLNGLSDVNNQPTEEVTPCNINKSSSKLKVVHNDLRKTQVEEVEPRLSSDSNQKLVFEAVFRKFTAKKHKTWEGDGTVEVEGRCAILKDEDGKEIGRASKVKPGIVFEEGTQLTIGGRDVELGTCLSKETVAAVPIEKVEDGPVTKKFKPDFKNKLNYQDFPLQPPSASHQWEFNPSGKTVNLVAVEPFLAKVLRPHQKEGVQFLYECVMGMRGTQVGLYWGAVLADEMGLGKTLTCITLIWTLLKQKLYGPGAELRRVLIVTPKTLVDNWEKDIYRWLGLSRVRVCKVDSKERHLKYYTKSSLAHIALVSYETYANQASDDQTLNEWDMVICDEAHVLKNADTSRANAISNLACKRKILLTGTPIQNNLLEFYELLNLANPGCLGTKQEFRERYVIPTDTANGQSEIGLQRRRELQQVTSQFMLKRTRELIIAYLPPKQDLIIMCNPSYIQRELYYLAEKVWEDKCSVSAPLPAIHSMRQIGAHPKLLANKCHKVCADEENLYKENALRSELCRKVDTWKCRELNQVETSSKLNVVCGILRQLHSRLSTTSRDKVLLISYFTQTLDLLQELCESENFTYMRLDGSTPSAQRIPMVNKFNSDNRIFVFLMSAKAGGTGLNLTGASRVILFDLDWNPALDEQALARSWRGDQKRPVITYRLVTAGTLEEKVLQRQIQKVNHDPAVAAANLDIKLSTEDLKDLFSFQEPDVNLTHDVMLKCDCDGSGDDYQPPESTSEDQGAFQGTNQQEHHNLGINELHNWQHLKPDYDESLLCDLDLNEAFGAINFIFRSVVELNKQVL